MKWNTENETVFFLVGNRWVWANGNVLTKKGDGASVTEDDGRKVVRIRGKYILQKRENLKSIPSMPENGSGEKEAVPVYLTFFYRCAVGGTLRVEFVGVDKTGFANFNSMEVEEELPATDGYVQYTCSGLWNGTGDFKLSFTGDIYLYMLILSTDRVESLAHRYKTLFEQSERLVKISAAVFDRDENFLQETGLVVKPEGAGIYAQDADGKLALIGVSVDETDADGNRISVVKLTGDHIKLEGLVTANENFKILADGSIESRNGKFFGEIQATTGKIGYFSIDSQGLYYGDLSRWTDPVYKQDLAAIRPGLIRLQSEEGYFSPGDIANVKVAIGNGADPTLTGSSSLCNCAGYFYRQMNPSSGDYYLPAVKIISDNVINRDVALYAEGAIVCQGGLLSSGHFNDTNSVTVLDFSFGTTQLIYNTVKRYVYLPTLSIMKQVMNSTGVFAVFVRLVARYENSQSFFVTFQEGQSSLYFRNNNGGHYGNDIEMAAGDVLELLLIYDGGNYYAQVLDRKT